MNMPRLMDQCMDGISYMLRTLAVLEQEGADPKVLLLSDIEYEIEGLPFTFYRSGGFSMEFNATGITSASELVNQIQLTINASSDNYTLLGASMANLVASTSSAIGVLKMSFFPRFHF